MGNIPWCTGGVSLIRVIIIPSLIIVVLGWVLSLVVEVGGVVGVIPVLSVIRNVVMMSVIRVVIEASVVAVVVVVKVARIIDMVVSRVLTGVTIMMDVGCMVSRGGRLATDMLRTTAVATDLAAVIVVVLMLHLLLLETNLLGWPSVMGTRGVLLLLVHILVALRSSSDSNTRYRGSSRYLMPSRWGMLASRRDLMTSRWNLVSSYRLLRSAPSSTRQGCPASSWDIASAAPEIAPGLDVASGVVVTEERHVE